MLKIIFLLLKKYFAVSSAQLNKSLKIFGFIFLFLQNWDIQCIAGIRYKINSLSSSLFEKHWQASRKISTWYEIRWENSKELPSQIEKKILI